MNLFAQKQIADSMLIKYRNEKTDTGKVILLWKIANASNLYNPDTSLLLAQQGLYLAQKIKYTEGESRSLGALATAFTRIGNYPKALDFYFQKLKIDENNNSHRNLASTYISIGNLYVYLTQYDDALSYYKKADSVIHFFNITELEYYSDNDLGDVYERLNINDSAFMYFSKALVIATKINDADFKGASMVGLGHIYLKQENYDMASLYYTQALSFLEASNDDDLVCEAALGLAKLYDKKNINDSAEQYALRSLTVAKKDGFESRQLEANLFLTRHYKKTGDISNAYAYSEAAQSLRDSIYSNEKIRVSQVMSSNEQLRQNEIAENKRIAEEERQQQLQILLIGVFIPSLFLLTLLLYRIKTHQRIVKFLAIVSLLLLFEYLLLLLNPKVGAFTNHKPAYEILIFALLASVLAPAHHRVEHWLIEKLTRKSVPEKAAVKTTAKPKKKRTRKPPAE